jgi:tyrosine-protein phosphatase YwqE
MANVYNNTIETINNAKKTVENDLPDLVQKLDFKAASEYYIDENFIENFKKNPLLTLKDNYVLVEMSFLNPPIQLHEYLFELQLAGYQPILAHPERYSFYHSNFKDFEKLKKMGLKFQLNLLSSVGYYGPDVAIASDKLLKEGFIDFVGSDIHHKQHIDSFSRKIVLKETKAFESAMQNNQFFF